MRDFFKKLLAASEDRKISLNDRLSARMILVSVPAGFFGMIVCILAHTHIVAVAITAFLWISIPICYAILIFKGKLKTLEIIMLIALIILMPLLWLFGGGLYSGMSIWILYELVLFAVSLSGKLEVFANLCTIFTFIAAIMVERYTDFHFELATHHDVGVSVVGSVIVAGGIIVYMINYQKMLYRREFEMVENKNSELIVMADKAEKANRAQKLFLANMSHEVRSPMNVVLGFNHLISESSDINEIHDFAKNIESAGESLLIIVNDILDFSKIETGKLSIYPAAYNLDELVQMCCSSIELMCRQKGLEFTTGVDPTLPKALFGDKMRLRQCITNLLTNAYKYTDTGSVRLDFINGGLSADHKSVILKVAVKDTGRGISEAQRTEIFTRFQRLDENTNRAIEGTGLGLALTKSILEMMGGTIDYTSEEKKGSEFRIEIRQEIVSSGEAPAVAAPDAYASHSDAASKLSGMCVLVVDDSSTNLVLMKHLLKQLNIKAVTATSGLETLERVKTDRFDMIFMDHMMPHMDGVETYRRMKTFEHLNKETPVIMLTANAMSGAEDEYKAEGFAGYLSKPVKLDDIRREMLKVMHKQGSHT
jgi:signal transduction histidine kinase/ActR/RegA family two-component response regulator